MHHIKHTEHKHHGHTHHHEVPTLGNITKAFYIGIGLNTLFTVIEFILGYMTDSLALIADASHNLSDVASLILSLIGMKLAQKASTKLYTYGYKKASIIASLINALVLVIIVIGIGKEAIERFTTAPQIAGKIIIITALIGVIINTISAFMFFKGQKKDINIKGAFLHLLVDALVSVGVVISGIIIYYTNWNIVDPIISLIIAIVIIISTRGLLKESIKLILDGVPHDIDSKKIKQIITKNKDIVDFHHLHIWALSSTENALTVHIIAKDTCTIDDMTSIKKTLKTSFKHQNISHITIEFEKESDICEEEKC
ncbi:MAG: cation transporter [candidate division SR1 bacterium]|nr:MAG: cation transporter [candidate division SR1 bacterium]